ncbi:MAG: DUF1800 domain-containing protein [Dehalococcoidia bacterium]
MSFGDERSRIAHLYRRAGFGVSPSELETAVMQGYDATLELLLNPQDSHDAADDRLSGLEFDFAVGEELQRWWLVRMRYSSRPLVEKMALFWHAHFTSAITKVNGENLHMMKEQNELFRSQGLGNFRDLLRNVSKDPAMILWLDVNKSVKKDPNENFGRELLELFTLGVGNFAEDDVKAAARAFTGWSVSNGDRKFIFHGQDHDNGEKRFLGRTGNFDGDDIVNILVQQPATAQLLATKLVRFFVIDPPDLNLVRSLAGSLIDSGYDIKRALRQLFKSDVFSSHAAYHALIKSPAEFLTGMIRGFALETDGKGLTTMMTGMSQELFNPPDVSGWPGGPRWIATDTMLARYNLASMITASTDDGSGLYLNPLQLFSGASDLTTEDVVGALTDFLVDGDLSAVAYARLVEYAGGDPDAEFDLEAQSLQALGLIYLLLTTPEYNLN